MLEEDYKWYIINAMSGHEKKVAQAIKDQADKKGVADLFQQIIVPVESVVEVRKGQKVNTERKILPGYIIVKMIMNDVAWHLIKNIPKVSGFLGASGKPKPVSEAQINAIFKQIEEGTSASKKIITFEIGESVKVIDGPFESFVGVVEEVEPEKSRLKVSVSIFGRSTPVDLEYSQVSKLD